MKIDQIVIEKFGKAQDLKIKTNELSTDLNPEEVLIKVSYSGINFADIVMRLGLYNDAPPKPFVPGYEVSGIIEKVGGAVTQFQIGDEVLAGTRFGGYSSHVKLNQIQVLKVPKFLNLQQAAAIPVNFMTAYLALCHIGRVKKNDKVMIDCATGGVGIICLQMLQKIQAQSFGLTRSENKKKHIEQFGATALTHEEFHESCDLNEFKFILNSSADPQKLKIQRKKLSLGGQILFMGMQTAIVDGKRSIPRLIKAFLTLPRFSPITLMLTNQTLSGVNVLTYFDQPKYLQEVFEELHRSPYLSPVIGNITHYKEVAQAHRKLELGQTFGKSLLSWQ